jgi:hypothetical protein
MLKQIKHSRDASICRQILATSAVLHRPVTVPELVALMEFLKVFEDDLGSVRKLIGLCGSFLNLQKDTVYFVHQSANDFLIKEASNDIFISGKEETNHAIYLRSLKAMHSSLHRNMYSLGSPGLSIEAIQRPDPDPLRAMRYSCGYWIDHLCDSESTSSTNHRADLQEGGNLDTFLRTKYLYWLETLGLCESMSKGVLSMEKLETLFNVTPSTQCQLMRTHADMNQGSTDTRAVLDLVRDARRFMMSHKVPIATAPLQAYVSALVFSPQHSLVRELFTEDAPSWLKIYPAVKEEWGACLQTLESHTHWVWSVSFSHDSAQIASGSEDNTVKVWSTSSGDCLLVYNLPRSSRSHRANCPSVVCLPTTVLAWST